MRFFQLFCLTNTSLVLIFADHLKAQDNPNWFNMKFIFPQNFTLYIQKMFLTIVRPGSHSEWYSSDSWCSQCRLHLWSTLQVLIKFTAELTPTKPPWCSRILALHMTSLPRWINGPPKLKRPKDTLLSLIHICQLFSHSNEQSNEYIHSALSKMFIASIYMQTNAIF